MSSKQRLTASVVVWAALIGLAGSAYAEGITEKAGKGIAKGAVKGAEQELDADKITKGAKQVTKGVLDGAADAAPMVTSQIANQANVNKKALGKVARQVTADAVAGAMGTTEAEIKKEIGKGGEGPMADALVALTERLTAAVVRGIKSETDVQVHIPTWTFVLAFVAGGVSTFVCGLGLLLLYIAFQRRRVPVATPATAAETPPPLRTHPARSMG